ncbi:DNA-dependent metalloprotease SPRTN [Anthophora plagiata]
MIKSQKSRDHDFNYELYQQDYCLGLSENAILPKNKDKENYRPKTLIDQTLELIDPTPNIHTLFVQFNERFFWNVLLPVEVKWSPRMTSCAGICTFHPRNRQCVISLSAPLLKLRPRKDLIETLLHEMIHGYLFLTNNNRDRDGHGPEFCKHMDRINKIAGTKITIYHNFHEEVRLYKQHWWRCNGPCQKRAPYFGTVRRAMNRAPGPNDFWWKEHQQTCDGHFIKIKEPENFKAKAPKNKEKAKPLFKNGNSGNSMFTWLTKTVPPINKPIATSTPRNIKSVSNDTNSLNGLKKLGNNTNNVHGWGTGGPNSLSNSQKHNSSNTSPLSAVSRISSSGVLGGSNTGRSNLLEKLYYNNKNHGFGETPTSTAKTKKPVVNGNQPLNKEEIKLVECPICGNFVLNDEINKHIDSCLITGNERIGKTGSEMTMKNYNLNSPKVNSPKKRKNNTNTFSTKQPKLNEFQIAKKGNCPVCNKSFDFADINEHVDKCLLQTHVQDDNTIILNDTNCKHESVNESILSISSTSSNNSSSSSNENSKDYCPIEMSQKNNVIGITSHNCLVCNELIPPGISLNNHLEECIGNVFNCDLTLSTDRDDDDETAKVVSEVSVDQNTKYPCPVCMQLITESLMNQHLDICLKNT